MQKQTEPLLLLFSKELCGDLTATHARQTTHKFCSHLHRHNSTVFRDCESCTSVAGKKKSSLKLFTELEKKFKSSPDLSLRNQHSTQGKAQLEAVGQLRIRSFLQQDFAPNTPDASGRINTNLAFDQLVLSSPHSIFSHYFHCGQFELFRTENERSFPKPSCDMCTKLLGRAPGGTGDFWGFLCYGNTPVYSRGGSRVPGLRSDPGYVPRYPHTPEPSTCSTMHRV